MAISLCSMAPAMAQTAPPNQSANPPTNTSAAPAPAGTTLERQSDGARDRRIEHIHIEDAATRIDELRVGGETQSITVAPKGGMPAYEVTPGTANRGPATADRGGSSASGGNRVWKILGF